MHKGAQKLCTKAHKSCAQKSNQKRAVHKGCAQRLNAILHLELHKSIKILKFFYGVFFLFQNVTNLIAGNILTTKRNQLYVKTCYIQKVSFLILIN